MRTFSRACASLFIALAIIFTGFSGPTSSSASASTFSARVIHWAAKEKGKPYRYGANGPSAFDCAGLVQYVYKKAGKRIGRTSGDQLRGRHIPKDHKRPGDVLVFMNGGRAYHSAIYAGHGMIWEAERSGTRVGKFRIWSNGYVVRRP